MAIVNVIPQLDNLKVGDTPTFSFVLEPVDINNNIIPNYNWTGVTADVAMTSDSAPTSNSDAAAYFPNQSLTINGDGTATVAVTLTIGQANELTAGTTYYVEMQLKQSGTLVSTVYTAKLQAIQDYVK